MIRVSRSSSIVIACATLLIAVSAARADDHGKRRESSAHIPHQGAAPRFVGVTSQRFTGAGTRAAMTAACAADYAGSRMAFSDEYARAVHPAVLLEPSWVQPRVSFGVFSPGTPALFYDQSGNRIFPEANCGDWTSSVDWGGTALLPDGSITSIDALVSCSSPQPVACVVP